MKLEAKMSRTVSVSQFRSEFDDFLFSPIGAEKNGMVLSVLSALARLNVDPWGGAAELARLPGDSAIQRLATLIASLPNETRGHLDSKIIATRLVKFLPRPAQRM